MPSPQQQQQQQPVQQPVYGGYPPESSVPQMSPQQQPVAYDSNTQSPGYTHYSTQPSYTASAGNTNTAQGYPPATDNYTNPVPPQQQSQPIQPSGYVGASPQDQLYNTPAPTQPLYNQGTPQQSHQAAYPPHAGTPAGPSAGQPYNIPQQPYAQNY
jgi:hypothetical protein